jgi:hypothetical protein
MRFWQLERVSAPQSGLYVTHMTALARLRHSFGAEDRPFIRVDRKWPVLGHSDAVDPKPDMANDLPIG